MTPLQHQLRALSIINAATLVGSPLSIYGVVHAGVVSELIRLLGEEDSKVVKQTNCALQLIVSKSPEYQVYAVQLGALEAVVRLIDRKTKKGPSKTLLLLCRRPAPPIDRISEVLAVLPKMLRSNNVDVISDGLKVIDSLTDELEARIQSVLNVDGLLQLILSHIMDERFSVPALRTIGNMAFGNQKQTRALIDAGVVPLLKQLLSSTSRRSLGSDVCWVLSNIVKDSVENIQAVIDGGLVEDVIELLKKNHNQRVNIKREALWVLANIVSGGTSNQVKTLAHLGAIEALCDVLDELDFPPHLLEVRLSSLLSDLVDSVLNQVVDETDNR